jgi:epoxide hydrolase
MNAEIRGQAAEPTPRRLVLPEVAWQRLRTRLGRSVASGEALDASIEYGAPPELLSELLERWVHRFEPESQPLFHLPCFQWGELCFVHARASAANDAAPLLLLHGFSGSLAEFQHVVEPLTTSGLHVVCPELSSFASVEAAAASCASLMARLGYERYLIHGSDLGAAVARQLAAQDAERVLALHVTSLPAYPSGDEALTSAEKSQLARCTELYDELWHALPESPLEELAFAATRLADSDFCPETLLLGMTLTWTLGTPSARSVSYQQSRLRPSPTGGVPVTVHAGPLDAPSLRRFAAKRHNVVEWVEQARGGGLPAIEDARSLQQSLRRFASAWRAQA